MCKASHAKAQGRHRARATYEDAIDRGKSAVLHEEVLRGIHMLSIAHIPAGETIEVKTEWVTTLTVIASKGHLRIPVEAFGAGLADKTIATTLCPGGKERMRRLVRLVKAHRINLLPLLTHTFDLDNIAAAYDLFANRKDDVLKVAIRVS